MQDVNYFTSFNCWLLPLDVKGVKPLAQPTLIYKKEEFWAFSQPNPTQPGWAWILCSTSPAPRLKVCFSNTP